MKSVATKWCGESTGVITNGYYGILPFFEAFVSFAGVNLMKTNARSDCHAYLT